MNRTSTCKEDSSYVLLTAAYNEERYIEQTIRSVVAQIARPIVWVIVSDGSTDRTDEIVRQHATRHPFIRFARREKNELRGFASKVLALQAGLKLLPLESVSFIGHLDADLLLDPYYFRGVLAKFQEDPELGIAGGWYYEKTRAGDWEPRRGNSTRSLPDGIQMFRRDCYKEIGALPPIECGGGEDWYAQVKARMCGWRVQSFPELKAHHLRPTGTRGSLLRRCYTDGFMDFALGTHPLFEAAKLAKMSAIPPYVVQALARMLGFLMAHIHGQRMVPPELVDFLQREQLGRLRSVILSARRGHLTFDV
jgi:glycosyl transferase family 2